jgi:hypothetical protein
MNDKTLAQLAKNSADHLWWLHQQGRLTHRDIASSVHATLFYAAQQETAVVGKL